MKEKIKKYIKEIVIFVVILGLATNILSYYRSMELNKEKLDIKSVQLIDSSIYKIKEDKPLIIYFWATWCPICKIQSPNIQELSKNYEVITIATQSGNKKEIQKYLKEKNLSFRVVDDKDGLLAQKFNIKVFPTTLIYNKNKELKFSEVGYTSPWGLALRAYFSSL